MIVSFNTYNIFESQNVLSIWRGNLSNGRYGCINFVVTSDNDIKKVEEYLRKLEIKNLRNISHSVLNYVYTFFTIPGRWDMFSVCTSGDGEHMVSGEFESEHSEYKGKVSPILSVDELIEYLDKHGCVARHMYTPKKIDRDI